MWSRGASVAAVLCLLDGWTAAAQVVEVSGSRALGMGGAFVAVASDSSATWWNPAGLAAGPFVDIALSFAGVEVDDRLPARQDSFSGFTLGTPPIGVSYYRFRIASAGTNGSTGAPAGRNDGRVGVPVRELSASQFGVTLVHSVAWGIHTGATVKFVSGSVRAGLADEGTTPSELLDAADDFPSGDSHRQVDLDAGLLAVAGPVRLGARLQNLFEPEFDTVRLPRQLRLGVAFDPEFSTGVPLTVSVDADVNAYETVSGDRRVVALGGEYWLASRRVGLRGGGRINTVGAEERTGTVGATVAIRSGLYVDGHIAAGDEASWGLAARVSF
jgi:hypothetical protein